MSLTPQYNITDIRISVWDHEFSKGMQLYEGYKVTDIEETLHGWHAKVAWTHMYSVVVDAKSFDRGFCDCYLGERDELCKHMIALAIAATKMSGKWEDIHEGQDMEYASCSWEIRDMTDDEVRDIQVGIREGMKLIRSYDGPSSTWWTYQSNLQKWSRLILLTLSNVTISEQGVDLCLKTLKKLDTKLCTGGVDDSDGTVWGMMDQIMEILNLMSDIHPPIVPYILKKLPTWQVWEWDSLYREQHKEK